MVPRFYPVLDTVTLQRRGADVVTAAEALLEAGAKILQYRHKPNWTQKQYDEARTIADMCSNAGALFVINDRADFAQLLGAALHIGQDDLSPVTARRVVGTQTIIGLSTHNRLQLIKGNDEPVQTLSLGPIYSTASKENPDPTLGLTGLARLRPLTAKPLVAIGGITLETANDVIAAGADSVAVISALVPEEVTSAAIRRRAELWISILK